MEKECIKQIIQNDNQLGIRMIAKMICVDKETHTKVIKSDHFLAPTVYKTDVSFLIRIRSQHRQCPQ